MPKLMRCEIRWDSKHRQWILRELKNGNWLVSARSGLTKTAFVQAVAEDLKILVAAGTPGYSLRIYKKNGQVQEERTYGPDPRRRKG